MINLKVPYFSQLDNAYNPSGSCNVTSVAMCLYYLGIRGTGEGQLEDQLYKRCADYGWSRHDPNGLKQLIESYPNMTDTLTYRGTFKNIKHSIDIGSPVIIHGYFTRSGHIIVIKGYDNSGFYVNDPNGEWFSDGYDNKASGANLHYSYDMMARLASPESIKEPTNCLIHMVSKGVK